MARFMLFYVYGPGDPPPAGQIEAGVADYVAWTEQMRESGRLVDTARLADVHTDPGRVCSRKGDEFLVTDGPFAETKEVVGGYAVIEATDYDEVTSLCRQHPAARDGKVVIRQLY